MYGVLMYGPGYTTGFAPRRPSTARLIVVRIFFVALSLLSLGLLAWGTLLRVAMLTRRKVDWLVFWGGAAATVLAVVLAASDDGEELTGVSMTGVALLLLTSAASACYFLYADVRHYDIRSYGFQGGPAPHPGPTQAMGGALSGGPQPVPQPQSAYGYPGPTPAPTGPVTGPYGTPPSTVASSQNPYSTPPSTPAPPSAQHPYGTPPPVSVPIAPSTAASPGRMDQVRAELDELSDYLRSRPGEQGRTDGAAPTGDGRPGPAGSGS